MKNKEKGVLQIDFISAFIIFMVSSVVILSMYYNTYALMTRIKVNEALIGYITEVCEEIDLENYDDITQERVNKIITACGIPAEYNFKLSSITKYSDTASGSLDLVKKLNFTSTYTVAGKKQTYTISKVKVKER